MKTQTVRAAAIALAAFLICNDISAQAQTWPPGQRPDEAVRVSSLRIRASVHDAVASTEIEEVLRNDGRSDAEAIWLLPLPENATADGFTMTVAGKEMAGEVLDAQRARGVYEDIVRRRRDPGLLEYFGAGCLRARIFPIPPQGDVTVKVRFRHILPQQGGMHEWRFPLRALVASGHRPDKLSLDLRITSSTPIKNVLSPLSSLDVVRRSDTQVLGSAELTPAHGSARDLQVLYGLSREMFGLSALTYRRSGEDGYFLLLLAPQRDDGSAHAMPRSVQFVLDTSGSMAGRKIEQAKGALRFFLRSLGAHDRFNVIPFATEATPFFAEPVAADQEALAAALQKVDRIEARGGTNIEDALRRALPAAAAPSGATSPPALPIVVFLTDGEPTVGQTDRDKLLAAARELNCNHQRVFVFGVGDRVDTKLLDRLADENGGARDYVREDEDIEIKTSDLFTKLSHPALTDLAIEVDGIETREVQPRQLPDLFLGSQLTVAGRYRGVGKTTVRLTGRIAGEQRTFTYAANFAECDTGNDFVATLWAQRKVAQLLDAIRLNGQRPELVDEVRRLAKEFGIVTPFTSHLIVEEGMRLAGSQPAPRARDGRTGQSSGPGSPGPAAPAAGAPRAEAGAPSSADDSDTAQRTDEARERLQRLGAKSTGGDAVADSQEIKRLGGNGRADSKGSPSGPLAQRAGHRTFYRVGERWIDGACPADWQTKVERIVAFSAPYFDLLATHPDLKTALALGSKIVIAIGERVVEVVAENA